MIRYCVLEEDYGDAVGLMGATDGNSLSGLATYKGDWSSTAFYSAGDVVSYYYNGTQRYYRALQNVPSGTYYAPDGAYASTSYWKYTVPGEVANYPEPWYGPSVSAGKYYRQNGKLYKAKVDQSTLSVTPDTDDTQQYWQVAIDGSAQYPYYSLWDAVLGMEPGDELRISKTVDPSVNESITLSYTDGSDYVVCAPGTPIYLAPRAHIGSDEIGWWEVKSVSGNSYQLQKKYRGPSVTIPMQQLRGSTIHWSNYSSPCIVAATINGLPNSHIKISGGWDIALEAAEGPDDSHRTGRTRILSNALALQVGTCFNLASSSYVDVSNIEFYIMGSAINLASTTRCSVSDIISGGCVVVATGNNASYAKLNNIKAYGGVYGITNIGGNNHLITNSQALSCQYGMSLSGNQLPQVDGIYTVGCNYGLYFTGNYRSKVRNTEIEKASTFGLYNTNGHWEDIEVDVHDMEGGIPIGLQLPVGIVVKAKQTVEADINEVRDSLYIRNVTSMRQQSAVATTYGGQCIFTDYGGVTGDIRMWLFEGIAATDPQNTYLGKGRAWKLTPNRYCNSDRPLTLKIATAAVKKDVPFTATIMVKVDAVGYCARLRCSGPGVSEQTAESVAGYTRYQKLTITTTPTEEGVLEFFVDVWTDTHTDASVYVDHFIIKQ